MRLSPRNRWRNSLSSMNSASRKATAPTPPRCSESRSIRSTARCDNIRSDHLLSGIALNGSPRARTFFQALMSKRQQFALWIVAAVAATAGLLGILAEEYRGPARIHATYVVGIPEKGAELFFGE